MAFLSLDEKLYTVKKKKNRNKYSAYIITYTNQRHEDHYKDQQYTSRSSSNYNDEIDMRPA